MIETNFDNQSKLVRIDAKGKPTLRSKQLPKSNKEHYDALKLPSQSKDPEAWRRVRALKLGASDFAKFTTYRDDIPALFKERLYGIQKIFSQKTLDKMEDGHEKEKKAHKKIAHQLLERGKVKLGDFEFSEVYLSKNRQYFCHDLPSLGAQLDAWGVLEGKKTIIEIKSTEHFNFENIKKALSLGDFELGSTQRVQDLLHEQAPYYYYQVQAQMLATGLTQAVLHIINRNTFESLNILIKADVQAFAWIEGITERYERVLEIYQERSLQELEKAWEGEALGFDLDYPAPKARGQAEEELKEAVAQKVKENPVIEEKLEELINLEKKLRSLNAKLTSAGFRDTDRKIYKKFLEVRA